ncbi:cation/acetate symporter ActP [Paraburkholderia sp. BL21I4N1]|uniref:cation/acetate symporter ActP n=1 Tax=Paraburkholderia sp. BL21I4N1 TaxID=1938801 RepID=UPI000CFBD3D8|nr:cation/acetate symporter ActP [Paraburkholderia sp. BL21I4N1]PQV44477.1 cation/acetate symporter [Paraburkholderia sp. BL21I4N1]
MIRLAILFVVLFPVSVFAAVRPAGGSANIQAVSMFFVFVLSTLVITWWASKRTRSTSDFYTAGGGITGLQNGFAMAGDYMSAATLLGMSGLVFSTGYDAFVYVTGFFVGWPIVTFLVAERLRNLGTYTLADVVSFRLDQKSLRILTAISSLTVIICYLMVQMVGAGQLIKLLFGLQYSAAVVVVGVLMVIYVIFGGMIATTWVQIIKAALLLVAGVSLALMAFSKFGFSFEQLAREAISAHPRGNAIMRPGTILSSPVNAISVAIGLIFGIAGLPHILMRFFTVPNAKEARKSVFVATGLIGFFLLVVILIGYTSIVIVGQDPEFFVDGQRVKGLIGGGNMVAMHLAKAVGGNVFLGFLSAVAFATILAVVSGLVLAGASAISHDLYSKVVMRGNAAEKQEMRVSRLATVALGVVAIGLGIVFERVNVAFLVGLAFSIAASANFPVLILSMYWRGLTTLGALWGGICGLSSSVALVVLSPVVWVNVLHNASAIYPYDSPALFSLPLAFIVAAVVSKLDSSERAARERGAFFRQAVRGETGYGASSSAVSH